MLLREFDSSRVIFLFQEELLAETGNVLRKIQESCGLEPLIAEIARSNVGNYGAPTHALRTIAGRAGFRAVGDGRIRRRPFGRYVAAPLYRLVRSNADFAPAPPIPGATAARLRGFLADDARMTAALLGRPLPDSWGFDVEP